jgi:hypothetical protein
MDAGNHHHGRAENEKVELISVRSDVDTAHLSMGRLSYDPIDRWVRCRCVSDPLIALRKSLATASERAANQPKARSMSSEASEV